MGEERTTKHLANLTVHPPQPFKKIRRCLLSYSSRKSGSTNEKIVQDVQHLNPIILFTGTAPLPAETNCQITPVMDELLRIARETCNAMNVPDVYPAVEASQLTDLVFSPSDAPSLTCDGTRVPVQHNADPRNGQT